MKSVKRDRLILLSLFVILIVFGNYMVYSASNVWANYKFNDSFYYLKRQILFSITGFISAVLVSRIPSSFLKKYALSFVVISLLLLALVLIPGIGLKRNGSRSWFGIGSFAIQPSEIFKIALVIYCAYRLNDHYEETKNIKGFIGIILLTVLGFILIMLQPDFGTAIVMLMSVVLLLFTSKLPLKYFIIMGVLGVVMMVVLILIAPYRFDRILSYFDPWSDPLGSGFQIIQSMYAMGPGALLGKGILNSYQKHFYLPEPQTDFIFSIVVEEFGLIGGLLLLVLFAMLFYFGFRYAKNMEDPFDTFLITGLLGVILIQVIINLGVVVALFPVTGITLPFISYGGSSLSVTMFSLGLILSRGRKENEYAHTLRRVR